MSWFDGFESGRHSVNGVDIFARHGGNRSGPALLLLHGFPQSHVLWHRIAKQLARDYYLVMPDLRGYGDSSKPPGAHAHVNYSKREMARDMAEVMTALGFQQFHVCGHDRGGRVAHRMALDHRQRVRKLCVIDIAPTLDMYAATDMEFARAYYHWFFLIQPAPLPEMMVGATAANYLRGLLAGWGSTGLGYIEPQALAEYERCFCTAEAIHAGCEDYRASAGIDLDHDRESRARGDKIGCDLLVLWGERGLIGRKFKPVELWQAQCAGNVTGAALPAGHFIAEELPRETADALWSFCRD